MSGLGRINNKRHDDFNGIRTPLFLIDSEISSIFAPINNNENRQLYQNNRIIKQTENYKQDKLK